MDDERLRELFAGLGPITIRRMFGGKSVYADGAIFAIVIDGELMLKGDNKFSPELVEAGCKQWVYENAKSGKRVAMPYWSAPDEALDDADEMTGWARKALAASQRVEAAKAR